MIPDDRTAAPAAQPHNTWEAIGCMDAYVFDLGNKTMWHDWNVMTNNNCHDFCAQIGFPYAATVCLYRRGWCAVLRLPVCFCTMCLIDPRVPMHVREEHEHRLLSQQR